jgi:hypothetical protein
MQRILSRGREVLWGEGDLDIKDYAFKINKVR